jgi:hypothetical protein
MFDAVQCFPKGSAPRLSAGAQDYEVVEGPEHGKIVRYVDPSSREPVHSLSYGYVTAFTYMHCQEIGKLSEVDVRENVKLQPSCGTFSYSEIPSFYQCCLGMTGTLDCECSSSACVCTQSADSHVMARNKEKNRNLVIAVLGRSVCGPEGAPAQLWLRTAYLFAVNVRQAGAKLKAAR